MAFEFIKQKAWEDFAKLKKVELTYDELKETTHLPVRSTVRSCGYDFYMPYNLQAEPGTIYVVGTGVKWNSSDSHIPMSTPHQRIDRFTSVSENRDWNIENVFLALYPRSSYGFKYGFRLLNTTGIIDADYYGNEDNDGHIMVGFTVDKPVTFRAGDKFCQGIIMPFAVCRNEEVVTAVRSGGVGSTGK